MMMTSDDATPLAPTSIPAQEDNNSSGHKTPHETALSAPPSQSQQPQQQQQQPYVEPSDRPRTMRDTTTRPFLGRTEELAVLQDVWHQVVGTTSGRSTTSLCSSRSGNVSYLEQVTRSVMVRGASGCGKTALVQEFMQQQQQHQQQQQQQTMAAAGSLEEDLDAVAENNTIDTIEAKQQPQLRRSPPFILRGKYEQAKQQTPFLALKQAFGAFFQSLQITPEEQSIIIEDIGGQASLNVLKAIIPTLASWSATGQNNNMHDREDHNNHQITFKSNQLHYAFGKLIHTLTSGPSGARTRVRKTPLLLILDDLQWADAASLDLLAYLITAPFLHNCPFLVVSTLCYHDPPNKVAEQVVDGQVVSSIEDQDGCLASFVRKTQDLSQDLLLPNHSFGDIVQLLCRDILHCPEDDPQCQVLASSLYQKTHGNILFTLHLIENMQRQGILKKKKRPRQSKNNNNNNNNPKTKQKPPYEEQGEEKEQPQPLLHATITGGSCSISLHSSSHDDSAVSPNNNNSYDKSHASSATWTKWTWDSYELVQFVEQSNSDTTLADAASNKIKQLQNPLVKEALVMASYLGCQFDFESVHALLVHYHQDEIDLREDSSDEDEEDFSCLMSEQGLLQVLDQAVLGGLLYNSMGSEFYQFSNDGIHQAFYNMIPAGKGRDGILFQIGEFLIERASQPAYATGTTDWMFFLAARHWNESATSQADGRSFVNPVKLARLNQKCGNVARRMTAFDEAARYFRNGLDFMTSSYEDRELWGDHYDLTVQLHQASTEMELLLGNYEKGHALGNTLLQKARTLGDKLPIYYSMDTALGLQERHDEALALNMEVLKELDAVPSLWSGIRDFFQVKKSIKNISDDEILNLPELTDPREVAISRCLGNAAPHAFCCGDQLMLVSITLKTVKKTLKYGLCMQTPLIFAGYGCALLAGMGHPKTGQRMGRLALDITSKRGFNEHEPKALYMVASMIELWTESDEKAVDTYERAYKAGLMSGTLDYAYASEYEALLTCFAAGRPIEPIFDRYQLLMHEMKRYNLEALARTAAPLHVLLDHLTSEQDYGIGNITQVPTEINWEDFYLSENLRPDSSNHHTLTWGSLYGIILAFSFGKTDMAEQLTRKLHSIKPAQSFFVCSLGSFYSALVFSNTAHRSRSSKDKNLVRKHTKDMKKLVDKGCTKTWHKYTVLRAEIMSMDKPHKQNLIQRLYDEGITSARACDCLCDEALANVLAGEYFLRQKRPHTAKHYLVQACSLYMQWYVYAFCLRTRQLFWSPSSFLSYSTRALIIFFVTGEPPPL